MKIPTCSSLVLILLAPHAGSAAAESAPQPRDDGAFARLVSECLAPGEKAAPPSASADPRQAEILRMEALPPVGIPLQDSPLSSAIAAVATAAGMNFVSPSAADFPESLSLSTKSNPWQLLQLLAERYRFSMEFRGGIWLFNRPSSAGLIPRTYVLQNTNLDVYKAAQNSFNMLAAGQPSEGPEAGLRGGLQEGAGSLVFTPQTQKIIDDVRELIGGAASGGRVLYLPDASALYITATEAQHRLVADYLAIVDQPVRQIRIEARFFETSQDPRLVLGLDPAGLQPSISLSGIQTQVDMGRLGSTQWPDKVLLSADTLRLQVNALSSDTRSKLVNNPTVVVANNREAYFSVGDEEPFMSASSIQLGGGDGLHSTSQARIAIRRVGTSVNLVPTLFPGSHGAPPRIRLAVRIEIGVLKGFRSIASSEVPVISSQKYEYTVFLDAGETLAFGGLSGTVESDSVRKVPLAGDIPFLGRLFKSSSRQQSQRNLVAYLTASVVDARSPASQSQPR